MKWACDAVHSYDDVFLSSMRLRGQLSGSGWRGRPAVVVSGGNDLGFTPRNRGRFLVSCVGGPVGPPPPSMVLVGLSAPWMELSAKSGEGLSPGGGGGPGRDANGNRECRHLLRFRAFLLVANLKKG